MIFFDNTVFLSFLGNMILFRNSWKPIFFGFLAIAQSLGKDSPKCWKANANIYRKPDNQHLPLKYTLPQNDWEYILSYNPSPSDKKGGLMDFWVNFQYENVKL